MDGQDPEEKKKRLQRKLSTAKTEADRVIKAGQEIVELGQYIKDIALAASSFINEIPSDKYIADENWDAQSQIWSNVNRQLRSEIKEFPDPQRFFFTTVGTTVSVSGIMTNSIFIETLPPEKNEPVNDALKYYAQVVHSRQWAEPAEKELKRFGLDKPLKDKKNPIDQIQAAESAFRSPSGPETESAAVLIPLREAIDTTIDELLKRRPKQEPAGNRFEKILSICRQAALFGFNEDDFQRISSDAQSLNNALSGGKQRNMSRDEIRILLDRGIAFLIELLRALDHERLRS